MEYVIGSGVRHAISVGRQQPIRRDLFREAMRAAAHQRAAAATRVLAGRSAAVVALRGARAARRRARRRDASC
eukprot:550848-Prymnesium_polylepis.1